MSRQELKETFEKLKGYISFHLSEPIKSIDFGRYGWIQFDSEDNMNKNFKICQNLII